jgi:murein DD-endopeptidase MepM/ murein hydrolase activator NlpD
MTIKSKNIIAIFAVITIVISSLTPFLTSSPKSIYAQPIEEELEQTKKDREEIQGKIKEADKTVSQYRNEVNEVEEQLLDALDELEKLNQRLSEAKSKVDKTTIELVLKEEELNKIEEELDEKISILNDRVASIYKNGNGSMLAILLKAEDFLDFISKLKLMNLFAEQDTQNVQLVKEKKYATIGLKRTVNDLREEQEDYKSRVERLVEQAEQKANEIGDLYKEKENLLSATKANRNALIQMEKELEIKEAELTRILESYKYGTAPSGLFMWPVAGRVISGFGMRMHPIFGVMRFHTGIDIAAPYGTLVKAADGGEVIKVGYFGGYGNAIVIYHGGGFATWYAHLSSIRVSVGQFVDRGQVIGLVGSTGWSTGPHLHFEVRINGEAKDPRGWLQ